MNTEFQLILLPGLGADQRLLAPQREAFPRLIVPPWIPPRCHESLPDYAERMCETVKPSREVPLILGGVSFGGMLAYEMARHLKPDAVVLIASCRERRGLRLLYRAARPLWSFVPVRAWSVAKWLSGPAMKIRSKLPIRDREVMLRMFKESDSRFMHWTVGAILNWRPTPLEGIPVFQVHGHRDRVLPARGVEADLQVNGGHLINVTTAKEVNSFIVQAAAMSQKIRAFHDDAVSFRELIDSLASGKPDHFYKRLLACMSRIACSANDLPCECFCSVNVQCNVPEMTHEEWGERVAHINQALGPEVARLIEEDKDDPESAASAFMFSGDLADIYRDLSDGMRFFDSGEEGGTQEAVWQWRFGYEHHWGLHLFRALHTVHRIRYELYEE